MKRIALIIILAVTSTCFLTSQNKVGIEVTNPTEKLEVAGKVFSNQGGLKFPDSTVQTTAAYNTSTSDAALPKLLGYLRAQNIEGPITRDLEFKDGSIEHDVENLIPIYTHELEINYIFNTGGVGSDILEMGPLHVISDISIASSEFLEVITTSSAMQYVFLYLLKDSEGTEFVYSKIALANSRIPFLSERIN